MRLIDADKLLQEVKINAERWAVIRNKTVESIIDKVLYIIEHSETVDTEPVRHGKWIKYTISNIFNYTCSVCNCDVKERTPFCPWCGSIMDEVK